LRLNLDLAKRRRGYLLMSQPQLAEKIGVALQTLSLWELGKQQPQLRHAVAWAQALDIPLTDLVIEQDGEPAKAAAP